ncbi:hypothetical protein ACIQXQ_17020 [Peribacillus sp. NPDC097198]|uniref:hypothetical protein n=1 Tax=Peribacillus sp. NPDC097198 TaxID=3364397 RepID=UPI0037FE9B9E
MKKWLWMGIVVIIVILGTLFAISFNNTSKQINEFVSFRDYIDNEYTPLFKTINTHLDQSAEKIGDQDFSTWYLVENGLGENQEIQKELENIEDKIINKDVKYADTLDYKKNILNQIKILEDCIETLNIHSTAYTLEEIQILDYSLSEDIKNLRSNIDETHKILDKYYD